MSNSGLIELISATGDAYLIGLSDAFEGAGRAGTTVQLGSINDWQEWIRQHFYALFAEHQRYWDHLLTLGSGSDQMARTATQTFRAMAALLHDGKMTVFHLRNPDPKPVPAIPSEGSGEARSQEPGGGGASEDTDGSEAAGVAADDLGPADADKQCQGDPVAPASGEEILILEDFTVAAPMPFTWVRSYRSSRCDQDLGLGHGWTPDCLRQVWLDDEHTWLLDSQARPVRFNRLGKGEITWQVRAGLRLERRRDNRMVLTEPDGRAWVMATADDRTWYPVSVQNLQGHQWRFHYDAGKRLSRIELTPERFLELAWQAFGSQAQGHIAQIWVRQSDQRTLLASYDYSPQGDLITSDSHHGREHYQYRNHLLTRRELPTGYGFSFEWQGQGPGARCLRSRGDQGHHDFRFEYVPEQYLTRVTDAFGNTQVFHYDDQGRITARQEPDGALYQWHYDHQGLLVAYQQPGERLTRYAYDGYGRKVAEQHPDGREHHWQYNELGHCTQERLPDGRDIQRRFDPLGRLLSVKAPDGTRWDYHYDPQGWLSEAISDAGDVHRLGHNRSGDLLALEQDGHLRRFAFNPEGRVAGHLEQDLVTEYDYQGAKLQAVHQYPEQAPEQRRSRQYRYDSAGRLTAYITATGDTHGYDYDTLARPVAYRRPDGHSVGYDYDLAERLTAVTRADGQQWQLGWNARGQVDRCAAPDGRDIRFHYNDAGDILRREHPGVWIQTLERDAAGRVLSQTSQGKDRKPVTRHYQYDAYGRRSHASCADRKLSWQWNAQGQVTEHHQDQHRIGYHYGPGGRIEQIRLPDGTHVHYRYDRFGRWTDLTVNGTALIRRTLDSQGRETERQAGNNTQTQIHDRYGCLIKRRWQGQTPATRRYRWDAENRLEAALDSVTGDTHYQRDPQGQLIKENDTEYHYDLGGNRLPEGGKIENDRLVETKTDKRQYDTLGAEIRVTGKTTGLSDSQTRQFDAEGQLIEVRKPGIHVSYGYDALGRRAWRKSEAGTTTYLWHNDVLLGEQIPDGQWQWYLRDPNTDEPLVTLINGQPHYYELDHRMMPIRLWDQSGDMVWQGNANAWGLCQPEMPKGHIHQPIRLPGQFEDELTGIVQNRFREYEPVTGGYLTADPLGVKGGLNSYRYTKNPVDFIDPLGLASCDLEGVSPEDAERGEEAAITEDAPLQNVELAGAAALARAPAPVPTPPPTPSSVPRPPVNMAAANDAVYTSSQRAGLTRLLPMLVKAGTFLGAMAHSPSLGGGLEKITAPDGTVYSKHGDERIWNAAGVDGSSWHTDNPQDDINYRAWLANGGEGSFSVWLASGKPLEVESGRGVPVPRLASPSDHRPELMSISDSDLLIRERTDEYLQEIEGKIESGELSKRDVGPVVAGVLDRRSGEFFGAYNDRNGQVPDPLHPLLQSSVKEMQDNPQHPSSPGSHAEIIALNNALMARGGSVTKDQLSEFTMLPLWAKGSGNGRMVKGAPAPRCGNCAEISSGVRNLSGNAPPFVE